MPNVSSIPSASASISGRVVDRRSGNGVPGAAVAVGPGHVGTTDSAGDYTVDSLEAGTYTLSPTKSGYSFAPAATLTLTVAAGEAAVRQNFVAFVDASVSGRVTDHGGNGLAGVTVSAGPGHSAVSDATGNYAIVGLPVGTHTLTPSSAAHTFTPPSLTVTVPPDATGQDFVANWRVLLPLVSQSPRP